MTALPNDIDEVYEFIKQYIQENQIAPSYREIASQTYLSMGKIHNCVSILEAQGRITRKPNVARSIRIVTSEEESFPK